MTDFTKEEIWMPDVGLTTVEKYKERLEDGKMNKEEKERKKEELRKKTKDILADLMNNRTIGVLDETFPKNWQLFSYDIPQPEYPEFYGYVRDCIDVLKGQFVQLSVWAIPQEAVSEEEIKKKGGLSIIELRNAVYQHGGRALIVDSREGSEKALLKWFIENYLNAYKTLINQVQLSSTHEDIIRILTKAKELYERQRWKVIADKIMELQQQLWNIISEKLKEIELKPKTEVKEETEWEKLF